MLVEGLRRWWRARRLTRHLAAARRAGVGLHIHEWELEHAAGDDAATTQCAEGVLAWCRRTLGECRRPYGIDFFDVTVAVTLRHDRRPERIQFRRLRPVDLYTGEGLRTRLTALLAAGQGEQGRAPALRVVAAIFSWGDAVHDVLPAIG